MARSIVAAFVLAILTVAPASGAELRVVVASDMSALVDVHRDTLVGVIGDLYQCVFDHSKEKARFVKAPLKRGLRDVRRGDADVVIPLAQSASRDQFADFGGALLHADYVFASLTPLPANFESLGLRYGIPRSFVGRDLIVDANAVIEEVSEWRQLPGLLERDRIDVMVLPSLIAPEVLEKYETSFVTTYAGAIPASLYMSTELSSSAKSRIREGVTKCSVVK